MKKLLLLALCATATQAAPINLDLTYVSGPDATYYLGKGEGLRIGWDPAQLTDSNGSASAGRYEGIAPAFNPVRFVYDGGSEIQFEDANLDPHFVQVVNGAEDSFTFNFYPFTTTLGEDAFTWMGVLTLTDPTGTLFSDDTLPSLLDPTGLVMDFRWVEKNGLTDPFVYRVSVPVIESPEEPPSTPVPDAASGLACLTVALGCLSGFGRLR